MRTTCVLLFLLVPAVVAASDDLGADKPTKGDWDFAAKKVWERDRAGDEVFGRPAELRVARDEMLYFHDFDRHVSYIFNREGEFARQFARQGKDAGEIPRYVNCFTAGDKVAIATPQTLEFFDREGTFVKSVRNDVFGRFPLVFVSEDEFLTAPAGPGEARGARQRIVRRNAGTGEEVDFTEFSASARDSGGGGGAVVLGLTPEVKAARDERTGEIYCGRSDEYAIHVVDPNGREQRTFGVKRARLPVTAEAKRKHVERFGMPAQRVDAIVRSLPNEMAYYYRIQANEGLIYVFATAALDRRLSGQQIDVFAPDGTYLFRGRIAFEAGKYVSGSPDNLQIRGDRLYVILEDDAGQKTLARYQLTLPKR